MEILAEILLSENSCGARMLIRSYTSVYMTVLVHNVT